jgi:hypothetical protein
VEIRRRSTLVSAAVRPGGESNTAFTQDERASIGQQLRAVLETVRETHALTSEQYAALDAKVEDVLEAAQRLARRDWRGYFIGAMVEVAVALAVSGSALSDVLNVTLHGLSQLFGGGLPALPQRPFADSTEPTDLDSRSGGLSRLRH